MYRIGLLMGVMVYGCSTCALVGGFGRLMQL